MNHNDQYVLFRSDSQGDRKIQKTTINTTDNSSGDKGQFMGQ